MNEKIKKFFKERYDDCKKKDLEKINFLAGSKPLKEEKEKEKETTKTEGPFQDFKSHKEEDVCPFPLKYAMLVQSKDTFLQDMAYLYLSLKKEGFSKDEVLNKIAPHIKDADSSQQFIDALEKAIETTNIDSPQRSAEIIYALPDEVEEHGKDFKKRFFEYKKGDEKSIISYNWSRKNLTPRGFWQLQFLARMAKGEAKFEEEKVFIESNKKDQYQARAKEILRSFYRQAILNIASSLMGRINNYVEFDQRDVDFNIVVDQAVDKMVDKIESSYDTSKENIGAWAFEVMKNEIINQIKKFTDIKLRSGVDDSGIDIAQAFESNGWNVWHSTLSPQKANIEDSDLKDVKEIKDNEGNKVYKYTFQSPMDAYAYLESASQGDKNNIFNSLTKQDKKKLNNVGARISVKKDMGYYPDTMEEPPQLDDKGNINLSNSQKNSLYKRVANYFIQNSSKLQSRIKKGDIKKKRLQNDEEYLITIGKALIRFISYFDYKYFWNSNPPNENVSVGSEAGENYLDKNGDILPQFEPYVNTKLSTTQSKFATEETKEEFNKRQENNGEPTLNDAEFKAIQNASNEILSQGINSQSDIGETIRLLIKSEYNLQQENKKYMMDFNQINKKLNKKKKELEEKLNKSSILKEYDSEQWKEYFDKKYKSEKSKLHLSSQEIEKAEEELENILGGRVSFSYINKMLNQGNPQFHYIVDRLVEEYKKGSNTAYNFLLSFYLSNEKMLNNFAKKTYQSEDIDEEEKLDLVKEAIMEKLQSTLDKYEPKATFNSYIQNNQPPQISSVVSYVNSRVERKQGKESSMEDPVGGDDEGGQVKMKDKIAAQGGEKTDPESKQYLDYILDPEQGKYAPYIKYLKRIGAPNLANAFIQVYLKNISELGKANWNNLFTDFSTFDETKMDVYIRKKLLTLLSKKHKDILNQVLQQSEKYTDEINLKEDGIIKGLEIKNNELYEKIKTMLQDAGDEDMLNIIQFITGEKSYKDFSSLQDVLGKYYDTFIGPIIASKNSIKRNMENYAYKGGFTDDPNVTKGFRKFVPQQKKHTVQEEDKDLQDWMFMEENKLLESMDPDLVDWMFMK